ncbi:pyridoxamine 5'-phosphate oxidase family protein [Streptomyces sp. NPDC059262]|uniref:pyridoxamine 5'-phosphate oxidase family protein n=1 Tax=Streptomyces sp. NPDC059262 TaxID=3346797 RepID=UPI00369BC4B0
MKLSASAGGRSSADPDRWAGNRRSRSGRTQHAAVVPRESRPVVYPMNGVREIDWQECPRFLATAPVGRMAHTRHVLAAVLPVPFCLYADSLAVVRTSAASQLAGAIDRAVIALQADEADPAVRSGWSVVVAERATVVSDLAECERLRERGPRSWRTSPPRHLLPCRARAGQWHRTRRTAHGPRRASHAGRRDVKGSGDHAIAPDRGC